MCNKKCRVFLWVSLTLFAFSVIAVLVRIIGSYYEIKTTFPNDNIMVMNDFGFVLFLNMLFIVPIFATELSCIRSVYKILKYDPKGCVKTCYIISSVLAFIAFSFQWLIVAKVIDFYDIENGQNFTADVLLFTQWPVFILSFILGSIHKKQDD